MAVSMSAKASERVGGLISAPGGAFIRGTDAQTNSSAYGTASLPVMGSRFLWQRNIPLAVRLTSDVTYAFNVTYAFIRGIV